LTKHVFRHRLKNTPFQTNDATRNHNTLRIVVVKTYLALIYIATPHTTSSITISWVGFVLRQPNLRSIVIVIIIGIVGIIGIVIVIVN
jgi:hypothetical protein